MQPPALACRAWAVEAEAAERRNFEARAARQHHLLSTQVPSPAHSLVQHRQPLQLPRAAVWLHAVTQ